MIGWNEVERREFLSLKRVPVSTLLIMLSETEQELTAVLPEGRAMAAERNGYNRIRGQLVARGEIEVEA